MSGKFDKIIKEKLKESLAGILRKVIGIDYRKLELLKPRLQHTLEREADLIVRITDNLGEIFVVHIEFQSENDTAMPWRMLQYRVLLSQQYRLLVRQYVVYVGDAGMIMPDTLTEENLVFRYQLVDIRDFSYRLFLDSDNTGEVLMAILANLEHQLPQHVAAEIVQKLKQLQTGLALEQAIVQLEILSQLRNLQETITKEINKMGIIVDIKKDPRYQEGKLEGKQEGKLEGKQEGKLEGKLEGKAERDFEIVLTMHRNGFEIATIQRITGLSPEVIEQYITSGQ